MSAMVLAIDQGTTGTTALVLDDEGAVRGRAYGEIHQFYPRPGWVEHDPEEIYRSAVRLARTALSQARAAAGDLKAVAITNQRETFLLWERRTGRPVCRAIVWQCRRSVEVCRALAGREREIARRTGLVLDPYFSGTKLKWLLDRTSALRRRAARGEICFGTIDTWLIFRLSRGLAFVTDYTNASRTMMLDLRRLGWDPVMLRMLGVPREMLARPVGARGPLAEAAPGTVASRPVPICASIGDQQAALYGHRAVAPGQVKVTYGTGAFLLMHTGRRPVVSRNRLLTTVALGPAGEVAYALEGAVFIAGAAIQWLRDRLGLLKRAAESEALARKSIDRSHPYLVPAFVGMGAPHWDSSARAALVGITLGTTRADFARAALDAIAYQVRDVLVAMERDTGRRTKELRADGGAAANDYLMQFQADLLNRPVRRAATTEVTALGAAMLAGLAAGLWRSPDEIARLARSGRVFEPAMGARERRRLIAGWQDAVGRVLGR